MTDLAHELAEKIIQRLNLDYIDGTTLTAETPLFKEGLGLDSLDALEISILIEEDYGITIAVAERGAAVFGTLGDLAAFVAANRDRDRKS